MNAYPHKRPRRLRRTPAIRELVREARLSVTDLIYPLFVAETAELAGEVRSMPGVRRHTLEALPREIEAACERGIRAVLLFGIPARKDAEGSAAWAEDGVIPQAVRRIRQTAGDLVIAADVCMCEYTDHGHCGLLAGERIRNDESLAVLAKAAVAYARAGADVVAPSAMLDGQVVAIRSALDEAGLVDAAILSYAVKYASSFYGPFRDAADCAPQFGDRRSHQMDPANAREALHEAELDWREGADMLMVKPAGPYLDVIRLLRESLPQAPLAAYQVSGEYSMIKAAGRNGWIDERAVAMESLLAIKRAGADMIITYFAKDAAAWI